MWYRLVMVTCVVRAPFHIIQLYTVVRRVDNRCNTEYDCGRSGISISISL